MLETGWGRRPELVISFWFTGSGFWFGSLGVNLLSHFCPQFLGWKWGQRGWMPCGPKPEFLLWFCFDPKWSGPMWYLYLAVCAGLNTESLWDMHEICSGLGVGSMLIAPVQADTRYAWGNVHLEKLGKTSCAGLFGWSVVLITQKFACHINTINLSLWVEWIDFGCDIFRPRLIPSYLGHWELEQNTRCERKETGGDIFLLL